MKLIGLRLLLIEAKERYNNTMSKKINTSWGSEADWYSELLNQEGTYQKEVILPNLFRLAAVKKGQRVLELGCGTGFFCRAFAEAGAQVVGVDIGRELISKAESIANPSVSYRVASADSVPFIASASIDCIIIVLSLQNIENAGQVIKESLRVLKPSGRVLIVLNHPAFRIPGSSSWGWDEKNIVQYRRLDRDLSEMKAPIQMHPGADPKKITWSFHRPLQFYFKLFSKNGFSVVRLEEWSSHTKTPHGPRADAENRARAEFPLFMCLELRKTP